MSYWLGGGAFCRAGSTDWPDLQGSIPRASAGAYRRRRAQPAPLADQLQDRFRQPSEARPFGRLLAPFSPFSRQAADQKPRPPVPRPALFPVEAFFSLTLRKQQTSFAAGRRTARAPGFCRSSADTATRKSFLAGSIGGSFRRIGASPIQSICQTGTIPNPRRKAATSAGERGSCTGNCWPNSAAESSSK